ncbi:MAG: phosphoadenylyl-sulfate reductase [Chloroflexia bacterium]|nr:phosphoadenylyl-sulfate reductase [Chloroflexia bacterium]
MAELLTRNRLDAEALAAAFESRPATELIAWAIAEFGSDLAIATSFQNDGMVILDLAWRIDPGVRVITVDSGRLRPETFELIDRVRDRYQIAIEVFSPDAFDLEQFVAANGVNPFYRSLDLRLRCCEVRKVEPLNRALRGTAAWISGQRRGQSLSRRAVRKVEIDEARPGLLKLNPLADWSAEAVWAYIRQHDVPYNDLYDQGFTSIGCAPCTRAIGPGEDSRAGRWWWETGVPKECGIHCQVDWATIRA